MIKIYIDWNVMSQMKNSNHKDLYQVLANEKFFIPYSTSHIGDIFSSYKETEEQNNYINSDLDFISTLTRNTCLFNDGKNILMDFSSPHELFQQRVEQRDLFQDISIQGLSKIFDDNETTKGLGKIFINQLKSISLTPLINAINNPDNEEQMGLLFPGLSQNPTYEGLFNSFGEMVKGLNEEEKYNDLRKLLQYGVGINRDKIFNNDDPYKIIDNAHQKLNINLKQHIDNTKNGPEWFNEIANEYIQLDMHGYQEDNINTKKGRKETFKNTTEDAFHTAFASTCHFYVLNDNKAYNKTIQLFKKLGIRTSVLKPDEFLNYYNNHLKIDEAVSQIAFPKYLIKNGQFLEDIVDGQTIKTYPFRHFLFNFFNILTEFVSQDTTKKNILLLRQNTPTNNMIFVMEIQRLVENLNSLLGEDIEKIGPVTKEEFQEEPWIGRNWTFGEENYRLEKNNGEFHLLVDTELKNKNTTNMIFNIYYINFPKVYEIKMMLSNVISLSREMHKENVKGKETEIRGQMGAKFLNFLSGEFGSNIKNSGSDSQKVLETFEIKTTKSIILNEIIEKSKTIINFNNVEEGQLIKIDNVNLSLTNEAELRTVKLIGSGAVKDMAIPGANGLDVNNAFNAMLKDYAYKMKGKVKNSGDEIIIKIPLSFESEFENSYSVDDLFIGRVAIVGLYKGKIQMNSLKNSFEFFNKLGKSKTTTKSSETSFNEVSESQYEESSDDTSTAIFENGADGTKEYYYIDLLAIVQNVNIPTNE